MFAIKQAPFLLALLAAALLQGARVEAGLWSTLAGIIDDELAHTTGEMHFFPIGEDGQTRASGLATPTLSYNRVTGRVRVELPAVALKLQIPVLRSGPFSSPEDPTSADYMRFHEPAGFRLDAATPLFGDSPAAPKILAALAPFPFTGWNVGESIEGVQFDGSTNRIVDRAASAGQYDVDLQLSPISPGHSLAAPRPAAATLDLGILFPPGLSLGDLQSQFDPQAGGGAVAFYANHRGLVDLQAPLTITVVPEPRSLELVCAAAAATLLILRRFLRPAVA